MEIDTMTADVQINHISLPNNAAGSLAKISQGLTELGIPLSISFDSDRCVFRASVMGISVEHAKLPIAVQMAVNQVNLGE
jgi:hypothetical protein